MCPLVSYSVVLYMLDLCFFNISKAYSYSLQLLPDLSAICPWGGFSSQGRQNAPFNQWLVRKRSIFYPTLVPSLFGDPCLYSTLSSHEFYFFFNSVTLLSAHVRIINIKNKFFTWILYWPSSFEGERRLWHFLKSNLHWWTTSEFIKRHGNGIDEEFLWSVKKILKIIFID